MPNKETRDSSGEPLPKNAIDQKDLCDGCDGKIINLPPLKFDATFQNPNVPLPDFSKSASNPSTNITPIPDNKPAPGNDAGPPDAGYKGPADAPTKSQSQETPAPAEGPGDFGSPSEGNDTNDTSSGVSGGGGGHKDDKEEERTV